MKLFEAVINNDRVVMPETKQSYGFHNEFVLFSYNSMLLSILFLLYHDN